MVHRVFNDAELGVQQPNPVEPPQPVCRNVARAPWHMLVDGWDWWGAEDGEVNRGE